ncbi:MAG: ABC transporter ATP-binding protein [Chloroflexota bacterium]|nr:ABC transporter ATP-binding protein [Chloroflexota bacterium]
MTDDLRDSVVHAREVHKSYGSGELQVHVLRGVSLEVKRGEMVAIMGPSGGGKTTLLNCMSGLDDIDAGTITIGGADLSEMSDTAKTRFRATRMGYIFQSFNLLPVLTALENVEMPLLVSGFPEKESREKALEALSLVGLSHRAGHYPSEMSGGQQQRVTIARALVNRPEIVWADEPTGNLDSETADEVMELLIRLNKELDETFVIVTHSDAVAEMSHRTVRMRDGLIADDGTGKAV